jgi:hypothetical protein
MKNMAKELRLHFSQRYNLRISASPFDAFFYSSCQNGGVNLSQNNPELLSLIKLLLTLNCPPISISNKCSDIIVLQDTNFIRTQLILFQMLFAMFIFTKNQFRHEKTKNSASKILEKELNL